MTTEYFWDRVKEYVDAKTVNLNAKIKETLDTYDWDGITEVISEPLHTDILNAEANATKAESERWNAEAEKKTADSYANEPFGVNVKEYYSLGNGGFAYNVTNKFSSLHWSIESDAASGGIIYQAPWTPSSGYPTIGADGVTPLESGMTWLVDTAETFDSINWTVGDRLTRNVTDDGWDRLANTLMWSAITGTPQNVLNAVDSTNPSVTAAFPTNQTTFADQDFITSKYLNDTKSNIDLTRVVSNITPASESIKVDNIIVIGQLAYTNITTKDSNTLYVIVGA